MRIISGQYKGLKLEQPRREITRPTSDKVRQSVFNILEHSVLGDGFDDLSVLDAFSGSGSLGLEALSRGAIKCVFVEKSKDVCRVLFENVHRIIGESADKQTQIICRDVAGLAFADKHFDLVFLDPPFKQTGLYTRLIMNLKKQGVVDSNTIFYTESSVKNDDIFDDSILSIQQISSRVFGDVLMAFWRLN